jgi:hypothetical protein
MKNYFRRSFTEERLYVPIPRSFPSVTRITRLPLQTGTPTEYCILQMSYQFWYVRTLHVPFVIDPNEISQICTHLVHRHHSAKVRTILKNGIPRGAVIASSDASLLCSVSLFGQISVTSSVYSRPLYEGVVCLCQTAAVLHLGMCVGTWNCHNTVCCGRTSGKHVTSNETRKLRN